jgi:ATP-dependent helicase/DNAse subunit B
VVEELYKEALRFVEALNTQAQKTLFKTVYHEVKFGQGGVLEGIKINVKNKVLYVTGKIDRVDAFDGFARVIDYKTGNIDTDFRSLYFGKKIQLYLYQAVIDKKFKPAGAYYLPIKNAFTEETNENIYKLKGYTLSDMKVILASDPTLNSESKCNMIEVTRNKDDENGNPKFAWYSKLLAETEFFNLSTYALALIKNAVEEIFEGNIPPSPLIVKDNPCESCKFFSVCKFDKASNKQRIHKEKIEISNFEKTQK